MSGAVDEDVVRSVQSGRETAGAMLRAAQKDLQKVFMVFVVGLIGSIWVLRNFVWNRMKADLLATAPEASVVAVTPFDVILLQVKVGLVVGIIMALPPLIYFSRDALRERGYWPTDRVPLWKLVGIVTASLLLFLGGVAYGYFLFFPLAFDFLANNAVQADFKPTYSIVKWAQFVFLLSISFGLAAQLPLAMSALSYSGIVRYQTFRDYWKHAILGLYALGALFTPPDPLTQVMWATPLVVLYWFSLQLSKFLITLKVSNERIGAGRLARERWNVLAAVALVAGVGTFAGWQAALTGRAAPVIRRINAVLAVLDRYVDTGRLAQTSEWNPEPILGLPPEAALAIAAVVVALAAVGMTLLFLLLRAVNELIREEGGLDAVERSLMGDRTGAAPGSTGDPAAIDVGALDAAGVRAAPAEAFAEMEEEEALSLASEAIEADDHEKAQAILDRFDGAQARATAETAPVDDGETAASAASAADADRTDGDGAGVEPEAEASGSVFARTGAGMINPFTEDEIDEDDVGGYYYDFAFILSSVTSKAFRIVGVFMAVLAIVFGWLYTGGIGAIKRDFLRRLPEGVRPEQVELVTLHPVEALIFEIKVSTVIAAVATLPILLYYVWPALKERGFARGDRRVLLVWGVSILVGLLIGSTIGYMFVAPAIISWLAADVIQANMVIAYRINNFGWLVFFTTVGVGLLANIPVTMLLFHRGGLVSYRTMRDRWREVTLGVFAVVAFLSPRGVFMMFILGIPIMLAYGLGLALLWVLTLGGRRGGGTRERRQTAD